MKAAVLILMLCTCVVCLTKTKAASDKEIIQRLSELNARQDFEASQALLLDFLKQNPGGAAVVCSYLHELKDKYEQMDRVFALASKVLPGIEKNAPEWSARVLDLRAFSVLYGRYRRSRDRKDLNQAKNDLILAITFDESITNAHINLAIVYGIDGNVERAKLHLQKVIDTANLSDPGTAKAVKITRGFLSMANERPDAFVDMARDFYLPVAAGNKAKEQSGEPVHR